MKTEESPAARRCRVPSTIADHDVIRQIGQGSYGEVWLVKQRLLQTYRALKIVWYRNLPGEKDARELRAIRHFEPISRMHSGLVQILHAGELEGGFYYIMELADDVENGRRIEPDTYTPRVLGKHVPERLSPTQCVEVGVALADALAFVHEHGFVHRDVKPANVVFVEGRPKLADVGLVTTIAEATSFVGTTGYVAPEGPISPHSDIFSMGKLLYEIATGLDRCSFPTLPPSVSASDALLLEINAIFLKACEHNPSKRYQTAAQLRAELELLQAGKSVQRLRQAQRRLRHTLGAVLLAGFAALAAFVVYDQHRKEQARRAEETQRRTGALLARGTERLKGGDLLAAWPDFRGAAEAEGVLNEVHRLRLGALLEQMPKELQQWDTGLTPVEVSESGKTMAILAQGRVQWLDNLAHGTIGEFGTNVQAVAISWDDGLLACSQGPAISIYDRQGKLVRGYSAPAPVDVIAFHPDGRKVAVARESRIWVLNEGQSAPIDAQNKLYRVRFSPSGKYLLGLCFDGRVPLYEMPSGNPLAFVPQHRSLAYWAQFPRDEDYLFTSSFDRTAKAWHLSLGSAVGPLMTHDDGVTSIAFSPDESLFVTAGLDGVARIWTREEMQPLRVNHTIYAPHRIEHVRFLGADRLLFVCTEGKNAIWSLPLTGARVTETAWRARPNFLIVRRPGVNLVAAGSTVKGHIDTHAIEITLPHQVSCVAVSPDDRLLAVAMQDSSLDSRSVRIYRRDGRFSGIEVWHRDGIHFAGFNSSGSKLITCGEDFACNIWDVQTGRLLAGPMKHGNQVFWAALNPSETILATGVPDSLVHLWDPETGEPIAPPLDFPDKIYYVEFTPGGDSLVAFSANRGFTARLPFLTNSLAELKAGTIGPRDYLSTFSKRFGHE